MATRTYATYHGGRGRAPSPFRRALTIIEPSKACLPQQRKRTGLASFRVGFGPGGVLAPIARGVLARASSPAPTAKMAEGTPSAHRARKHGAAGGSAPRAWPRHRRCGYCRKLQEPLLCTTVECTGKEKIRNNVRGPTLPLLGNRQHYRFGQLVQWQPSIGMHGWVHCLTPQESRSLPNFQIET